ncbi:MAG: hypothetical protein GC189_01035 [Alphaproteobacteria bacterium]|nr:hypothetical protein [Alphaproteobacteria bacterium]
MRLVKTLLVAAGLALTPAAATTAAAQAGPVIVLNYDRVFAESAAGNDVRQKLEGVRTQMRNELQPESQAVQAETERVQQATQGQTQEAVRANTALMQQINALQQRTIALAQREQQLARDLQYTEARALQEYNVQLTPIVREVMQQRGANAVLNSAGVTLYTEQIDATADVLQRLNASVQTINVTRQTAPAPQQPGASGQTQTQPPAESSSGRRRRN